MQGWHRRPFLNAGEFMFLKEFTKTLSSKSAFAKEHGLTRQALKMRESAGWKVGKLDGAYVMYNPKKVTEIKPPKW